MKEQVDCREIDDAQKVDHQEYVVTEGIQPPKIKLYSDRKQIICQRGEDIAAVTCIVSPEGCYMGNGEYEASEDDIFRVIGFDRRNGREFWIGRGWVIKKTN